MESVSDAELQRWEPWQRAYRHGAFYVVPPNEIAQAVDELRKQHDPVSHAISRAHISITEPLPRPLTDPDVHSLRQTLLTFPAFQVTYSGPRSTDPHAGVVYWIEPQDAFRNLRELLHREPIFDGKDEPRRSIPAHMTIAEFLTVDESNRLAERLAGNVPEGHWLCDQVEYAVPDADFRFERRLTLPLGRSKGRTQEQ